MFDPEERKKKMERMKREAREKAQLPPLGGRSSEPPGTVSQSELMDRDDEWVIYFVGSEFIRNQHGVKTVDGKWEIVDWEKFNRYVDKTKRSKLRSVWRKASHD